MKNKIEPLALNEGDPLHKVIREIAEALVDELGFYIEDKGEDAVVPESSQFYRILEAHIRPLTNVPAVVFIDARQQALRGEINRLERERERLTAGAIDA